MAEAKARLVSRAGGEPCSEAEAHHARLAFVALEDERAATAAALRLKRLGLLVNVADMPELCDFTLPSILERDPVLIAIGTSGASAGLAKHLRLRLEAILPPSIGSLAEKLGEARDALRSRFSTPDERRRALDEALGEGGTLDVLDARSANRVDDWLAGRASASRSEIHEFVLASDDPDDLTLRQARLLGKADAVLYDAQVPEAILNRARADAVRRPLPCDPADESSLVVVLRRT